MIDEVRSWVREAERIVVLTGAGISTDSGIPDFRGPNGIWTKNPEAEKLSTLQHYVSDPDVRRRSWQTRLDSPMFSALPGPGHLALADLDRQGRLHALITQNVDGLHQAAGVDPDRVIEVHGTVWRWACLSCEAGGPIHEAFDRVRQGEDDPACLDCGGIIKSATISFGQSLVPEVIQRAEDAALAADLFLAVGSTLGVYPVAGTVPLAHQHGARVVIVNNEPTSFDGLADAVFHRPIAEVLPALVAEDGTPA
jgi:NAD-dependent deacetylase